MTQHTANLLGVDTGGTFTDFVLLRADGELVIHKVLSTPDAPEQAILQGMADLGLTANTGDLLLVHGSTVATNAALEGKGARTLFVTNRGFADLLTLGRQARRDLYNLTPEPESEPVPAALCFEVSGRLGADGDALELLNPDDEARLQQLIAEQGVEAVAITLLFSYLQPAQETAVAQWVPESVFCSRSSDILPHQGEYERALATWMNSRVGPVVKRYLQSLQQHCGAVPISIMQSSGETIALDQAHSRAVNLLLSGPAGGLAAARFLGQTLNTPQLMTFDMGGTSTDVALLEGDIRLTDEGRIGPYPIAVPMVDMHTIGAGGGSIAYLDEGGLLQVGPASAGAAPGPVCYGRGGEQPTVSDANAVLGRLRPENFLGGRMGLDVDAARRAMAPMADKLGVSIEACAEGIIRVANEHMTRALRTISVQKGYNPVDFHLCCFGGAGGLHVCDLAENLNMQRILAPLHGGVLSAFGMLVANKGRQIVRALPSALTDLQLPTLQTAMADMRAQGLAELQAEGVAPAQVSEQATLELRYVGQSFTLALPMDDWHTLEACFHDAHRARYGHAMPLAVELVSVRLALTADANQVALPSVHGRAAAAEPVMLVGEPDPVPCYWRQHLHPGERYPGPALVVEETATLWIKRHWCMTVTDEGHIQLLRDG